MTRLWSDKIEIGQQATECPEWLKEAKAGEWRHWAPRTIPGCEGADPKQAGYWIAPEGYRVTHVSRLLDEGWLPASTMPRDETRVAILGFSGKLHGHVMSEFVDDEMRGRSLCWRPHAEEKAVEEPKTRSQKMREAGFTARETIIGAGGLVKRAYRDDEPSMTPTLDALESKSNPDHRMLVLDRWGQRKATRAARAEADRQSCAFFAAAGKPFVDHRLGTVAPMGALCGGFRFGGDE